MAKYMLAASYTAEGMQGLIKDSAKTREAAIGKMLSEAGGKLDAVYWSLGDSDAIVICDLPDGITAAAMAMTVTASGAVKTKTTPLFTAKEVDEAISKKVSYRAPGSKKKNK